MTAYNYKALDDSGKLSKGIIEGESERQVRNQLRQRRLKPVEVAPARPFMPGMQLRRSFDRQHLGLGELALFTRQLATLVHSGVTLDEAIAATARQNPDAKVKSLLLQIRGKVVAGHSLAASLADYPQAFSELYRAMVRAGERAGLLGEVLEQLADYIERRQFLQQKLQMALAYPLVLLCVALGVITLLMVMVMPELVTLFERTRTVLPLLTRGLIAISAVVASWWWLLLILAASVPLALRALFRNMQWRRRRDRLLLHVPLLSRLVISADTARFAATLSILTSSGVGLLEALTIAAGVMGNLVLRSATLNVVDSVQEGGSLARALEKSAYFSPMLIQMVASGESSGTLETMLRRAAQIQERDLEFALNSLMKVLEPLIIVVMAIVVGAIVMAVLLPIMQMNTLVN